MACVNENWDDINTYQQVKHPDTDISPIQMRTMHHLPEMPEVDHWFRTLPMVVQKYLLPLQSTYHKWFNENVRDLPHNYAHCKWCQTKTANLQRHFMQHHARWRTIWFCPVPGCPVSTPNKEGLVKHLQSKQHAKGVDTFRAHAG